MLIRNKNVDYFDDNLYDYILIWINFGYLFRDNMDVPLRLNPF